MTFLHQLFSILTTVICALWSLSAVACHFIGTLDAHSCRQSDPVGRNGQLVSKGMSSPREHGTVAGIG